MEVPRTDNFENKHSSLKLLLIVTFSILLCELAVKYLRMFLPFPSTASTPVIDSVILVTILSPVLYLFFYRPLSMQFEKLKKAEFIQRELSLIDELTGLYNRRGFLSYANHLLSLSNRTQKGLIIIYADLDGLKRINDYFGHEIGNKALICIAKAFERTFRSSDVIGRIGGDEFAILALEAKAESFDLLRKRVRENLKLALCNSNFKQGLMVSLGIMYYNPEKPQSIEELLNKADKLMYEEKNSKSDALLNRL